MLPISMNSAGQYRVSSTEMVMEPGVSLCNGLDVANTELQAKDNQIGGSHYKDMAIQPAEYIEKNGLSYLEGCVIKYTSRHRQKGKAQDLRKAIHCLQLLLDLEYGKS
jgi:hypothetical protein